MTKLRLLLVVCLVYVSIVSAEVCDQDSINGFFHCNDQNIRSVQDGMKQLEEDERKCFTEYSCKVEGSGIDEEHHPIDDHCGKETEAMKIRECHDIVDRKEHDKVSACVKNATGYTLPEEGRQNCDEEHEGKRNETDKEFEARLLKSCDGNTTKAANVEKCLEKIMKTANAKAKGICTSRKACFEYYEDNSCTKTVIGGIIKNILAAAKICFKDHKPNFEELAKGVKQCEGLNSTQEAKEYERGRCDDAGSGEEHSGSGHFPEHHDEQDPIDKMCEELERNVTTTTTASPAGHRYGRR